MVSRQFPDSSPPQSIGACVSGGRGGFLWRTCHYSVNVIVMCLDYLYCMLQSDWSVEVSKSLTQQSVCRLGEYTYDSL